MNTSKVLVTGGAGFIGSHICDKLITMGHQVICYDNLITGFRSNISHLEKFENFTFIEGDIRDKQLLSKSMEGCTHINHQAALGSIPRSIDNPIMTNDVNVNGGLIVLYEAKKRSIKRFVFASSSSVYGDDINLPKIESRMGGQLSPYAITKYTFEQYAKVFKNLFNSETIGLRYFNVFGPRQSPIGPYAAVIPLFVKSVIDNKSPTIFGDGTQTRDFSYIENVVNANILALFTNAPSAYGECFNVACGNATSINKLFRMIKNEWALNTGNKINLDSTFKPNRKGDVKDSLADLNKIKTILGYEPKINTEEGIKRTVKWHFKDSQ